MPRSIPEAGVVFACFMHLMASVNIGAGDGVPRQGVMLQRAM
jgi:hypothetical protein